MTSLSDTNFSEVELLCKEHKIKLTDARRLIAKVISNANDHPYVEEIYERVKNVDRKISLATVYRTLKIFEAAGIVSKHDFQDGRSRYEAVGDQHDHIIDIKSGEVKEFADKSLQKRLEKIANEYGFDMVEYKLEIYVIPKV